MLGATEAIATVGHSPVPYLNPPTADAAAHGVRMRLLQILLLILPILPIVQLATVWFEVGVTGSGTYFATMHAALVVCWLILAVSVLGLLRRRSRLAERRMRLILASAGSVIAVLAGAAVALVLPRIAAGNLAFVTKTMGPVAAPQWDAGATVALAAIGMSALVLLGWPSSGLAWSRREQATVSPGRLVPGMLLVLIGTALAHVDDTLRVGLRDSRGELRGELNFALVPDHHLVLPLAFGLVATAGWLLVCLAFRGPRARTIAFAYAGGALARTAALTNSLTRDAVVLVGYGLLPAALLVAALPSLRRLRARR